MPVQSLIFKKRRSTERQIPQLHRTGLKKLTVVQLVKIFFTLCATPKVHPRAH